MASVDEKVELQTKTADHEARQEAEQAFRQLYRWGDETASRFRAILVQRSSGLE